jgi:hypothetical protein
MSCERDVVHLSSFSATLAMTIGEHAGLEPSLGDAALIHKGLGPCCLRDMASSAQGYCHSSVVTQLREKRPWAYQITE